MPVTEEQIKLLKRQAELVEQLKQVLATQRRTLEALGASDDALDGTKRAAARVDSDNEAETQETDVAATRTAASQRKAIVEEVRAAATAAAPSGPLQASADAAATDRSGMKGGKPFLANISKPAEWSWPRDADRTQSAPAVRPMLEHVYGYQSRGCRENIAFIDDSTVLYHAAAVGVIQNIANGKQAHFVGHTDKIVCLDFNGVRRLAATGDQGQHPSIHVWSVDTPRNEPLATFRCHERAVLSVRFSLDGQRLASIGLDANHTLFVHDIRSQAVLCSVATGPSRPFGVYWNTTAATDVSGTSLIVAGKSNVTFWASAAPAAAAGGAALVLRATEADLAGRGVSQAFLGIACTPEHTLCACENGDVYALDGHRLVRSITAHTGAVFAIAYDATTRRLVTGGRDGFVKSWDHKSFRCLATHSCHALDSVAGLSSVRAIHLSAKAPQRILVGTAAAGLYDINSQTSESRVLFQGHSGSYGQRRSGAVNAVAAHPTLPRFYSTGDDATLRLWDSATHASAGKATLRGRGTCLNVSADGRFVVAGLDSGSVVLVDSVDGRELAAAALSSGGSVQAAVLSPDGKLLAVASLPNFIDVFAVDPAGCDLEHKHTSKHGSEATLTLDFSKDNSTIAVSTRGFELLFVQAATGNAAPAATAALLPFASPHSRVGWNVQGLWPTGATQDPNSLEAVSVSRGGHLVVCSDDSGFVKLYQYPSVGSGLDRAAKLADPPRFHVGQGHSGPRVVGSDFLAADSHIVTVGGSDATIMQWKLE